MEKEAVFRLLEAVTSGIGNPILSPGRKMVTMISPIVREIKDAVINHAIVFAPIRPTVLESPICAIPTTSVENTSGAMIILTNRRKTSVTNEMYPEIVAAVCLSGNVLLHA